MMNREQPEAEMNRLEFIDDLDLDNGLLPPKPILRDEPVLTREFLINTVSRVFDVSPGNWRSINR